VSTRTSLAATAAAVAAVDAFAVAGAANASANASANALGSGHAAVANDDDDDDGGGGFGSTGYSSSEPGDYGLAADGGGGGGDSSSTDHGFSDDGGAGWGHDDDDGGGARYPLAAPPKPFRLVLPGVPATAGATQPRAPPAAGRSARVSISAASRRRESDRRGSTDPAAELPAPGPHAPQHRWLDKPSAAHAAADGAQTTPHAKAAMHLLGSMAAARASRLHAGGVRESPRYQRLVDELDAEHAVLLRTRALSVRAVTLARSLQTLAFVLLMADMLVTYLAAECHAYPGECKASSLRP
jgi:hypothetical protein